MKTSKKFLSVFLCFCLLISLFSGCQSEQDELYSRAMEDVASDNSAPPSSEVSESSVEPESESTAEPKEIDYSLSGTLTVRDFLRNSNPGALTALEVLAEEFMELHPNVTVNVEYFVDELMETEEIAQLKEAFSSQVRMELVSGEADYVLFSAKEEMNLPQLAESGVLLDLLPYWENDPEINPDDYFTSVLDTVSVNGKLTTVPLSFAFDGLFLNRSLMEELNVDTDSLTAVNYKTLLDWYDQAPAIEPELQVTYGGWMKENFFGLERSAYIDLENNTASFDSPEFAEFLTRTGNITEPDTQLDYTSRIMWTDADFLNALLQCQATGEDFPVKNLIYAELFFESAHPSLACLSGITPSSMAYFSQPMEYLVGPYPFVNSNGELSLSSKEDLSVPASISDPDLAWEFVKYCISERDSMELSNNEMYTYYFPINKQNHIKLIEEFSSGGGHQYEYAKMMGNSMSEIDAQLAGEKLEEYLSLPLVNAKLYGVDVQEYLDEFYINGLTTAEQCAGKIQDRTYIWLNE